MVERIKRSQVWLHFTGVSADKANCHKSNKCFACEGRNMSNLATTKSTLHTSREMHRFCSQIQIFTAGNLVIGLLILTDLKQHPSTFIFLKSMPTSILGSLAIFIHPFLEMSFQFMTCVTEDQGCERGMKATDLVYYMSETRKNKSITRQHLSSATNIPQTQRHSIYKANKSSNSHF